MTLDVNDIQGNILRGYRKQNGRHFALQIGDPKGAAGFIGDLIGGDADVAPQITTAVHWNERPVYTLNLGITYAGFEALELPESTLELFPEAFRQGPAASADRLGDTGPGAPSAWEMGGPGNEPVHMVVSLFTDEHFNKRMKPLTKQLCARFKKRGLTEVWRKDATALRDGMVHFGYRDGIAQPRIKGVPFAKLPEDNQPFAEPGDFLLGSGFVNQFGGNFRGDLPNSLVDNGTYAAFRVLKQNVRGFERFIRTQSARWNMPSEMIAAKLMGRWRSGVPLALSPERPQSTLEYDQWNAFDYAAGESNPNSFDDKHGVRCPIGSHIRRLNPRGSLVMGKPHSRRIIRRGMPYGPEFDPGNPDDGIERGLVGLFICGDLSLQFEFLQGVWGQQDMSTAGLRGTREPILGVNPKRKRGRFVIRTEDTRDPIIFDNLPRLVTTRGSVYSFIPGIGGLRHLAGM